MYIRTSSFVSFETYPIFNNIYYVTDPRVPEEDSVKEQNIFVYFPLGTPERSERMEKFLKENNFLFLMSNDVPFTD